MGDKHLYYLGSYYWQLDDRDQAVVGYSDLYNGGYVYRTDFTGDVTEVDNDCYSWSNYDYVCFNLSYIDAEAIEEEEERVEVITVSGHSDESYNGDYVRGNDWYDGPHFVMDDRHLYFLGTSYIQLDDRDQEVVGFSDLYNGGYEWGSFTEDITELDNDCYYWSNSDYICFELSYQRANATATEEEEETVT